ncbi:MAG: cysteine desulfurase NifS [Endomicrobiales bacterium]
MKRVYLDHSATTPVRAHVREAMSPFLDEIFGNPSSVHGFGQEAKKYLEDFRESVARSLNAARPEEIIFTGCGTEADNLAIKGVALANREKGNHIITSQIEHHAVLNTCEYLAKNGFEVTFLPVDEFGRVRPADVAAAIKPNTILISIMHANNEVGTIEPIEEIGLIAADENKRRTAAKSPVWLYVHTDAVQTTGKIPIDVRALGVDLLSLSAHKFYGPKGVGALYVKKGTRIQPILHGGHHERNLRAGTENVAGIAGLAKALELAVADMQSEQKRLEGLRDQLEIGITQRVQSIKVNGDKAHRMASVTNISFAYIEGEGILLSLDLAGIAASTGSACASGSLEPSHVLKAMCVETTLAQGAVRFSLGHQNTQADIEYVLQTLPPIIERLRSMSPLYQKMTTS